MGFWGSGSPSYIYDVVPAILGKVKGVTAAPLFVWSSEEATDLWVEDGGPSD